jgi:hypothetical protein
MERARMDQRARAQAFVGRGWFPFPVEYRGKRPAVGIKWGTATATRPTPQMLDLWFGRDPMNIGIAARPSGLVILDADRDGAMEDLCAAYGQPVPQTYRVQTAKGWHYYFDAPQHVEIGNSPGPLKEFGFDVRGGKGGHKEAGGYVVGAGSLHETGHGYAAADDDADTIELPWWLTQLLVDGEIQEPSAPERAAFSRAQARTYVQEQIALLRAADERSHDRNNRLNNAALAYGHFVPALCTAEDVHEYLTPIAQKIGLRDDEIGPTINSGLQAGMADPYPVLDETEDEPIGGTVEMVRAAKVAEQLEKLEIAAEAKRLFNAKHQPRAGAPVPMSLSELLALPDEPIRYRVDGLLGVGGRILLAAAQKAGKTTLMGNLLRCLVDGGEFLGRHTVEPVEGSVVLLDTELPQRTLKEWLGRQHIRNEKQVIVLSLRDRVTSFDLTDPAVLARWVELLGPLDPGFVILDCLRPVLDAAGLDEKNEAGRFLVPFGEMLGRLGVEEACLVQHMGHTGERARGDSGLLGWADANWKIVRKDGEDDHSARFFSAFGRDVDVPECELGFNSMTGELRAIGGNRKDAAARSAIGVVLDLLREQPGLTGRGVETGLAESDFRRDDIRRALKLAVSEGLVVTGPPTRGGGVPHTLKRSAP